MKLRLVGLSHRTAPVEWRERLAVPEGRLPVLVESIKNSAGAVETVVLSTCNRVEVYAVTPDDGETECLLRKELSGLHLDKTLDDSLYSLEDDAAVRHLFRVAAGLDSLVIGESEILGQVKRAYDLAQRAGSTGKLTNVLFQRAIYLGKKVRTATKISEGPTSVPSLAVALAERIFGDLSTSRVFVLGAGPMAEMAVRALKSQKVADLLVANRTGEKAEAMARQFGGRAIPFDRRAEGLVEADIVLCSTGAPDVVITRNDVARALERRRGKSLFLIDIAVPRDVDASVNDLENTYLYNVDDLESLVAESLVKRRDEIQKADGLVDDKTNEFAAWYRAWLAGDTATLRHAPAESADGSAAAETKGGIVSWPN
ncbi:MAG TPA: glutamyl-tRNA reductase [Elusimicrobiota bacterium]|nr:glutamyl-tRNA reductase [Elusimicrobiota bacterium]HNI56189.1 glutamyl-tRNA reductase [Elusimicrobiota bacterium]